MRESNGSIGKRFERIRSGKLPCGRALMSLGQLRAELKKVDKQIDLEMKRLKERRY